VTVDTPTEFSVQLDNIANATGVNARIEMALTKGNPSAILIEEKNTDGTYSPMPRGSEEVFSLASTGTKDYRVTFEDTVTYKASVTLLNDVNDEIIAELPVVINVTEAAPVTGPVYRTDASGVAEEYFDTIHAAISDADSANGVTEAGDTIVLSENLTTDRQVTINQPIVIDGNGHTLSTYGEKDGNSKNSVINIIGTNNVTISNLIIDGTNGTDLHGINVYESTNVQLNNVASNNNNAGLIVNSSSVTAYNITTSGNAWYAMNVDQKTSQPAMLTVKGASSHAEAGKAHIYVDDSTKEVVVRDVNEQYSVTTYGNAKVYVLTHTLPNISGPKINVIAPADDSTVAGEITVNVKATDPDGDAVRNVSLKFLGDNDFESSSYNLEQIDDSNMWKVTLNTKDFENSFGRYTLKFNANDDRDKSRSNKSTKINIDNANPKITTITPLNGDADSGDVFVKVKIDERGAAGLNRVYVKFQENGSDKESGQYTLYREGDTDFYSRTINTNEFESGSDKYTLKFVANDTVGNSRSHKSVNNFLVDNASPSIQFLSHEEGDVIGGEETVRVKITDDSPLNYVTFKLVGSEFGESHGYAMQKVDGTANEYEVTFDTRDTVPAGETTNYNFKVSTEDAQSHNRSSKLAVTIDNEASDAPIISAPSESQEFPGTPGVIRAEWSTPDDTSGIDRYQIRYEYTRDGSVVVDTRDTDNPYRDQQLSGGVLSAFTIDVRAQDNAGNWSEWSDAVTYYYGVSAPSNENEDGDDSTSNEDETDSTNTDQATNSGSNTQQSISRTGAITALTQPIFANAANNGLVFNGSDVLGAQDDEDENTEEDDAEVLGTQDNGTPLANTGAIETGNDIFKIFGLAWFWWLAIASVAVAGWLWLAAAIRRYRGTEI
ncbi:MAG TPA: hypothetical protein VFM68_04565, partial [Candidatus Saccharimonadales bacterium]|nr:hypothetical protein [Candidatus Saccharimonadales bacterium]